MFLSPTRWFALPSYLALRGGLQPDRYLDTRSGRFQVRIAGLAFVGVVVWIITDLIGFSGSAHP